MITERNIIGRRRPIILILIDSLLLAIGQDIPRRCPLPLRPSPLKTVGDMSTLAISFLLISITSLVLFYFASGNDRRLLVPIGIWVTALSILSYSGFFQKTEAFPPRVMVLFALITAAVVYLYKTVQTERVNAIWLHSIHILRIPVELVLYQLFLQGEIPQSMTFAGWNYDIAVGITALPIIGYWLLAGPPTDRFLRLWNAFGIIMLGIIVTTAVLSAPTPLQQLAFEQPNVAILRFPYTLLPGIVVVLVFVSHILALKYLRQKMA